MPSTFESYDSGPLAARLASYGCTDIVRLDAKLTTPEQLDYLDLLPTRSNETPILSAVVAHQGTALLYVLDASDTPSPVASTIGDLSRQLANRSDPAWLGVLKPGSLEIFPIGFHERGGIRPVKTINKDDVSAPLFFQSLVHGTFEENSRLNGTDYVYQKIFDLLMQTTDEFVPKEGKGAIDSLEVLSMAGRALFFRFLIDRRIVLEPELQGPGGICPSATGLKDTFSSAEKAARTSAWLDSTFNGDFLPLINETIPTGSLEEREREYLAFYKRIEGLVGRRIFSHLHAILRGWRAVGGGFQQELDWGDFDFAHIPVGVLSQVYESFSHRADPRTARDTSVHYTPRTIANFMVDEAFAAVKTPSTAKVLDSACGAGIFLVLAYRRLVRERWLRDEERPKTAVIQDILYKQIRGFDISESALRLAALALYITAIELNGTQRPPQSLKFPRNIRGEVLYRFGGADEAVESTAFHLGSLGSDVPSKFDHDFDIVIGNPPWTRLRDKKSPTEGAEEKARQKSATKALNKRFTAIGRRVLNARGYPDLAQSYENPDKNPDLPFLWRAMEWARSDGVIALAMHGRLFTRTHGNGRKAWLSILESIQITGLLNGSDLRKTAVWEGIDVPFCLFFARNNPPPADQRFQFASPLYEPDQNGRGRFRIDYEAAQQVKVERAKQSPWLLKTLTIGTWLDVELMEHLTGPERVTLAERWSEWDPEGDKTGEGYNRAPASPQSYKRFLADLPVFEPPSGFRFTADGLATYGDLYGRNELGESCANMPRREALFQPPLVIVARAPGENPHAARAYISRSAVAFSKSYYGYSCAGHPYPDILASLIYLLAHSSLFRYFSLMVSASQGSDFMLLTKQDFDTLPFPDIASMADRTRRELLSLAQRLENDPVKPWDDLDRLIFEIYGIDPDFVQVMNDTLFSAGAYRKASKSARDFTSRATRAPFIEALSEALNPYFDVLGERVAVREAELQPDIWREPWYFLTVSSEGDTPTVEPMIMQKAMDLANQRGCSRIIIGTRGNHGLLVGLLNQRRWWTVTRARICSQHIIRDHLDDCGLAGDS